MITMSLGAFIGVILIAAGYVLGRAHSETEPGSEIPEEVIEDVESAAEEELDDSDEDQEKLPAEYAVLFLLEASDNHAIEGRTRLQKLVFLMQEEWDEHANGPYPFERYEFVPYDY